MPYGAFRSQNGKNGTKGGKRDHIYEFAYSKLRILYLEVLTILETLNKDGSSIKKKDSTELGGSVK